MEDYANASTPVAAGQRCALVGAAFGFPFGPDDYMLGPDLLKHHSGAVHAGQLLLGRAGQMTVPASRWGP